MEILVGVIVALIGLLFYKNGELKKAKVASILGNVKGQDKQLVKDQELIMSAVNEIDERIKAITAQKEAEVKERQRQESLTLKQRAEEARKKFDQ